MKPPRLVDHKGDLSKRWYVELWLPGPDGNPCRSRYFGQINRLKTLSQRRAAARELLREVEHLFYTGALSAAARGVAPPDLPPATSTASRLTLAEGLALGLKVQAGQVRPRSLQSVRSVLGQFATWAEAKGLGQAPIQRLSRTDALAYLDSLSAAGLGPATRNNHLGLLRSVLNKLLDRGHLETNPFAQVRPLREYPSAHLVYTHTQQREITTHLKAHYPRLYLLVAILYYTLARPGEIRRLPFRSYDLRRKRLHIPGRIAKNGHEAHVGMPEGLVEILVAYDLERFSPDDYPFSTPQLAAGPRPCAVNAMMRAYRDAITPLGYGGQYTLYSWKHTGAIRAVEAGVQLKDLQLQLRHASLDEVDRYLRGLGHLASDQLILRYPRL